MKQDVLGRYARSPDGELLIDVAAEKVADLYNNFDRNAPHIRRDLDQDLVDYLIDCAREIGHEPFAIRFTLSELPDPTRLTRIQRSINVFFLYLAEVARQEVRRMLRKAGVYFAAGLAILFVSVWVNHWLGDERSVVANVFAEGFTVAAWVSLWEALATLLVTWPPYRKDIALYRRLAHAQLIFRAEDDRQTNR